MKKFIKLGSKWLTFVLFVLFSDVESATTSLQSQPSKTPTTTSPQLQLPPLQRPEAPALPAKKLPKASTTQKPIISGELFTLPGMVGLNNNQWVGGDNFFNLSNEIQVVVEIAMPEGKKLPVSKPNISNIILRGFSKAGIIPHAQATEDSPPLPMFHLIVFANSVEDAVVGFCAGRLFEAVELKRVNLEKGITFQAITWEKQDLIIASEEEFPVQLDKSVQEITQEFVTRFTYFQSLKTQGVH